MNEFKSFIEAIEKEDFIEVKRLFRKEYISERLGEWTALHFASHFNNKCEIIDYLLSEGFYIEDESTDSGDRCIHLSVQRGNTEVLKKLIAAGCLLNCINKAGKTAIDIAIKLEKNDCIEILNIAKAKQVKDALDSLEKYSLSKIMDPKTGTTLLDYLVNMNEPEIIEVIRLKPVDEKEVNEWRDLQFGSINPTSHKFLHECILARCLIQKYHDGVDDMSTPELLNKESLFMGPTALELIVESGLSAIAVKRVLYRLVKEDESWTRAENIAKERKNVKVVQLLSKRRGYLMDQEIFLHKRIEIASIENDTELIEYLLDTQPVLSDEALENAIELCYKIGHNNCAMILERNKMKSSKLEAGAMNNDDRS